MKPAQTQSPFSALSKQEQREKWHAWQSTHMHAKELPADEKFLPPNLPPLKLPMQQEETRFIPRHNQYDAVIKRMQQASENIQYIE